MTELLRAAKLRAMRAPLLVASLLLPLASCAGIGEPIDPRPERELDLPRRDLAATWDQSGPWDFERYALGLGPGSWSASARRTLTEALAGEGERSVRAAVLLARGGPGDLETLRARLEQRVEETLRHGDAAEVVAAAALARSGAGEVLPLLVELADGASPHPDLEVRVECGAGALDRGRTDVIPFLLRVLHAGTPAELADPIDWTPVDTLAWSKSRAAEALSRRAGVPCRFQPDGPFADQQREAARLAAQLRAAGDLH